MLNHPEVAVDFNLTNGGEGGDVAVGAEGGLREDGTL